MTIKILHAFDHSLPVSSGYSLRSMAILREQRLRGWQTLQLTGPKHGEGRLDTERVGDIEFLRVNPTGALLERLPVVNQWQVVRQMRKRIARVVAAEKPDIIQAHSPCLNGLAALGLGIPVVYELRASWEDGAVMNGTTTEGSLRYDVSRWLESYVLRRADAVTTICDGLRTEVISRGVAADKVTVIPNAVDAQELVASADNGNAPDFRQQLGLENCFVLGFLGSYFAWEGLSLLIEALPHIIAIKSNVRVLLVGGGQDEPQLRAKVAELGMAQYVVFKGRVPHSEVSALYRIVDALVYPRPPMRLTELVTPLKPLEAMAMGKVVLASDVGGHKELIENGRTGVLFKAGDAQALARTVIAIMDDPALRQRLKDNGPEFVRSQRTWAQSVARYAPVFEQLVAARR